ncbi:unnamed protein product [Mucor hiemalis]
MPSNDSKQFWFKKNPIVPSNDHLKNLSLPPPPNVEIIKLSTINGSGIYMPPSPSDEFNSDKDYFAASDASSPTTPTENFQLPLNCDNFTSCSSPTGSSIKSCETDTPSTKRILRSFLNRISRVVFLLVVFFSFAILDRYFALASLKITSGPSYKT